MPKNLKDFNILNKLSESGNHHYRSSWAAEAKKVKPQNASSTWVVKKYADDHPLPAEFEVLAAELYRLFQYKTSQPKTRLVIGDNEEKYIASKKIDNFINFGKNTDTRNLITHDYIPGLASILVISLFVGQLDLNKRDNGITINNEEERVFVHFDDNNALMLMFSRFLPDFSSKTIHSLPFPVGYAPISWLDMLDIFPSMIGAETYYTTNHQILEQYKNLWQNEHFQHEKYLTLAKISLVLFPLLEQMISHYITDIGHANLVKRALRINQQRIIRSSLELSDFRQYLTDNKEYINNSITSMLANFCFEGKQKFNLAQNINELIISNYDLLLNPKYIVKLTPSKDIGNYLIELSSNEIKKMDDPKSVINFMKNLNDHGLSDKYKKTLSIGTLFYKERCVYGTILDLAKKQVISLVKQENIKEIDNEIFEFLNTHYLSFSLGHTKSAQAYLQIHKSLN